MKKRSIQEQLKLEKLRKDVFERSVDLLSSEIAAAERVFKVQLRSPVMYAVDGRRAFCCVPGAELTETGLIALLHGLAKVLTEMARLRMAADPHAPRPASDACAPGILPAHTVPDAAGSKRKRAGSPPAKKSLPAPAETQKKSSLRDRKKGQAQPSGDQT